MKIVTRTCLRNLRPLHSLRFHLLIYVAITLCGSPVMAQSSGGKTTNFSLDPKGAYVLTNTNPAPPGIPDLPDAPLIISLASLGVTSGSVISGVPVGDINFCSTNPTCTEQTFPVNLCGVFSSSNTLLPDGGTLNRVPGAIAPDFTTAIPCGTPPTLFGGLPTDIPQDFSLAGEPVTVPKGALYLFIAVNDSFYSDNSDPNGDAAVAITVDSSVCDLGLPDAILPFPGGPNSKDKKPTSMTATFNPTTNGVSTSLSDAAAACGYTGFDWQQSIERWPAPSNLTASSGAVLQAPPSFYDPPPGGYAYFNTSPTFLVFAGAYPFYYNPAAVPDPPITTGDTLNFLDQPKDSILPAGDHMAFRTRLVGLLPDDPSASDTLYEFTWESTYSGATGTGGVSETATVLPDDGSGIGGITITSINGVPQAPPTATCSAVPNILWPPSGKSTQVTVSGTIVAGTSGVMSSTYAVTDEYSQIQPCGNVSVGTTRTYSFPVSLIAARNGNDFDGRTYAIYVRAQDKIGNVGVCAAVVTVPHDLGNK